MWTRSNKQWYYASKCVNNWVFKYTVYSTSYRRSSSKSRLYRHCQVTDKHIDTLTVKMWGCELIHVWLSSERVPVTLLLTRLTASLKWQFCHADEVHRRTSADVTLGWVKARFRSGSLLCLLLREYWCVCMWVCDGVNPITNSFYGGNFLQGDSIRPLYIEAKCTDVTVKKSQTQHTLSLSLTHRVQRCNTQIQQTGCQSPSAECLSSEEFCRRVISTNRRSDPISLLYKYYDAYLLL